MRSTYRYKPFCRRGRAKSGVIVDGEREIGKGLHRARLCFCNASLVPQPAGRSVLARFLHLFVTNGEPTSPHPATTTSASAVLQEAFHTVPAEDQKIIPGPSADFPGICVAYELKRMRGYSAAIRTVGCASRTCAST
jgi:hypothetical protein